MMISMFPCAVEEVFVNDPWESGMLGKNGLFGKVRFKYSNIPNIVMGPNEKVFFSVYGRPMICRRFISKSLRTGDDEAAALGDG
ncbi:hypothetical protein CARUB_v10000005mg, partial [Capsella rubella]